MLADVAALTALYDCGLDGVDYLLPGRIRSLFSARGQGASLAVFAQDWSCRVQVRFRAPCERPLPAPGCPVPPPGGYLPPEGVRLPGLAHAEDAAPSPPLAGLACATGANPRRTRPRTPPCWKTRLTLNISL